MSTVKWILSGLLPAFATGSAILVSNPTPNFVFWWAVSSAFVGGLVGKSVNGTIDNAVAGKNHDA